MATLNYRGTTFTYNRTASFTKTSGVTSRNYTIRYIGTQYINDYTQKSVLEITSVRERNSNTYYTGNGYSPSGSSNSYFRIAGTGVASGNNHSLTFGGTDYFSLMPIDTSYHSFSPKGNNVYPWYSTELEHSGNELGSKTFAFSVASWYKGVSSASDAPPISSSASFSFESSVQYALSISAATGSTITVTRTSSEAGAATGALSNGDPLYIGDELTITFTADTGYALGTHTVNGIDFVSGSTYVVDGDVAAVSTTDHLNYLLSLSAGTYIDSVSGSGGYHYNDPVTASAVLGSATGYTYAFDGWYDILASGTPKVSGSNPYSFSMPAAATVLEARGTRTANTYTVHFEANGGSGTMTDESFTYDQAQALTANAFTRTGYSFLGWSTNSSDIAPTYSDEQSVSNLAPSGTVTLYAIWRLDTYLLSITTSHGSVSVVRDDSPIGSGSIGALSNGATLYYNDELTITFTAATGYTITTHTVNGTPFTSGNTFVATGAVEIVQGSTANTYSVIFNPNRGTGSGGGTMANQTFTYDVAQNLTANAFTRYYTATFDTNGGSLDTLTQDVFCSFKGWATSVDGATQYTDQQSVMNLTPSGSTTLYARWQYGRVVFPEPTRTGYTFRGWYDAPTGGSKVANAGGSVQLFQNATYYAQWDAITYPLTVSYSDNGVVVNVFRSASPYGGGAVGQLNNGDVLYYGDALSITYALSAGYQKKQATVNGVDFGGDYSGSTSVAAVSAAVVVVVLVKLGAIVYIGNTAYQAFVGAADGSAYKQYEAFMGNAGGTAWDAY